MHRITEFFVGLLFGLGLLLSGMTDPAKVLGFLDLFGTWDPSLAFVMGGAIAVGFFAFALARKRTTSFMGGALHLPRSTQIDKRLVLGGLTFGAGWGLAGFCPGPGVVSMASGEVKAAVFVVAMVAGMAIFEIAERTVFRQRVEPEVVPMNFATLSETVSVAGQISPADLQELARAGFKSVICNRPDGESPGQFSSQDLATAASQVGLTMAYLPVVSGRVTAQDGREFGDLLNQLPTPVLAYCRSGMRSATLWALSQAERQAWPELVQRAAQAGFNLSGVAPPTKKSPL